MIHPRDEQTLLAILGVQELPPELAHEYDVRINMYHRGGASGPLGILGLIDLVRSLGLRPPQKHHRPTKVDWRALPHDGTVRIEASFATGEWSPGVFLGFVQAGTLMVQLDGESWRREAPPFKVRLEGEKVKAPKPTPAPKPEPKKQGRPKKIKKPDPKKQPNSMDWATAVEGDSVWVSRNGEDVDGTFVAISAANSDSGPTRLLVRVEGEKEPLEVEVAAVTYVGK